MYQIKGRWKEVPMMAQMSLPFSEYMHVDRWPGQTNGREVEVVVTPNNGDLGPVTHSFPPSHQGGCGTIKRSNHHRVNHPMVQRYLGFETDYSIQAEWGKSDVQQFAHS